MKRIFSILLCLTLISTLVACGSSDTKSTDNTVKKDNDKISIVTTIFPEYDWTKEILGDNSEHVDLTMLLDSGVDLHSYQPTAEDIMKIATCDLFIYVGGESDNWVKDALKEATNKEMKVINLLDALGDSVKEEEIVEGMESEEEEEDEEEIEYDEHVWLSLKNAKTLVRIIADTIGEIDTENASLYSDNADAYIEKLSALDEQYQAAVDAGTKDTILFGDRFPFRYLANDYDLNYYAAFAGCSAETEASFETVVFLSEKVDELELHSVLTIEGTDHKLAETIIKNTSTKDQTILAMDSMQGTTSEDVENGADYLSIMEKNLEVLSEALE